MTHSIAIQKGSGYEVHHFEDEATARAFIAVNRISGARRLSDAHGRKLAKVDRTGERFSSQVESLATALWAGDLDQPMPRVDLATQAVQRRTYTRNGTVKVIATGQRIGLLTPGGVVNAIVAHLGNNFVTVNLDNGTGRRSIEKRIDVTTTGPGLTLSAIVSPQSV